MQTRPAIAIGNALDRSGVLDLVALQNQRFELRPDTVGEIMPACILMKRSAGL